MKRLMVVALAAALFTMVGCQKKATDGSDPKMMSQDDCAHCPGVQKANADGTCPECKMQVKDPKMMSADACDHCPGIQTANAEGKCPICSEKEKAAAPAPAQ
jgi:hypothetical protein